VAAQVRGMKAIRRVFLANFAGENRARTGALIDSRTGACLDRRPLRSLRPRLASHKNFAFAPVAGLPDRRGGVVGEEGIAPGRHGWADPPPRPRWSCRRRMP
jgi:hypothetical protein